MGGTLRGSAPGSVADTYNSGTVQLSTGNLEEAERLLAESVRRNPEFQKAWNNLGVCLMRRRMSAEALECFRKALSIDPSYEIAGLNFEECRFLELALNR